MKCLSCLGNGCVLCDHTGKFINHRFQVDTDERYTPAYLIDDAVSVMGCIDFDPASTQYANRVVKATRFYTREQNGLDQEWYGNGWCNPPYGRIKELNIGLQALFIKKGVEEYIKGDVMQMMFLLHGNCMFREWFLPLRQFPICMLTNDVIFYKPDGTSYHNGYGSVIVYLGENTNRFYEVFRLRGIIYSKYEPCYMVTKTLPNAGASVSDFSLTNSVKYDIIKE